MDKYEIFDEDVPTRKKRPKGTVWNILTILVLVTMMCVLSVFLLIFIDPNSSLNPFPPPTVNPALFTPTPTTTLRFTIVPSWTPTTVLTSAPATPSPTHTPLISPTPVESPTPAPQAMAESSDDYAFAVQKGSPAAIAGTEFHPDVGCNWSGVAGQATTLNGESVKGLFIQLGGTMPNGVNMDNLTVTGLANQYGPGGFELTLADKLIASTGTLWIQLLDQQNLPLSGRIYFDTYDDCQKNLVIIYFTQVR